MTSDDIIKLINQFGQLQFQAGLTAGILKAEFTDEPTLSAAQPVEQSPQAEPQAEPKPKAKTKK